MFKNWKRKYNNLLNDNARLAKENREQRYSIKTLAGKIHHHHTYTLGMLERQYEKHNLGKPTCEHCNVEYDWDDLQVWLRWSLSDDLLKAYNIGDSGCEACSEYVGNNADFFVPKELYKETDGQEPNEIGWSCAMGWPKGRPCCDPPEALVRCQGPGCREVTHASDMCPDLHHAYEGMTAGPHWCKYCCRSAYEDGYADTDLTCECYKEV